ncbi:MAG: mercuric reductase [Desulfobacterales bacterium]|jgi:pyruvate/2-oxoglutarate dehydrogenase complex dihydrolipoamide dehydrogenase (E3) component
MLNPSHQKIDPSELPQVRPYDAHNQRLVGNVHPADWVNPEPDGRYNMVVIGAGTAGLITAAGTAGLGGKVALIERSLMGGDCLNVGCVPSKALIRAARAAADVRAAGQFGIRVPDGTRIDFAAIMKRLRRLRADISQHDSAERFSGLGMDVFLGSARFTAPDTVEVDGKALKFARACIATGSRALELPIPGLADVDFLTNETVFSLTELPPRLGVIGAGPIGCELAQAFARFGSQVILIEAMHGIMPNDEPRAAQIVETVMAQDGVKLRCCGKNIEIRKQTDGIHLVVDSHGTHYDERVDRLLLAVGRTPNVEGLNLEAAGVSFDKKGVQVNERLQTTNRRIYAAGDICFPYKFTHTADATARIVIQNALFFGRSKSSALTVPWCTYTDPEVAHVGLYPRDAEEKGIAVDTITVEMKTVDRAILEGDDHGFLDVYVKKGTDEILGATMVCRHAGDMISEISVAMAAGAGLGTIARTIHPYPTQAEAIKKAGDVYNRTRLTPRVQKIFNTLLKWRR